MKRTLVASLGLLLMVIAPVPAQAAASAKVGGKCLKVNSVNKVGEQKLICTKVGSKLIWKTQKRVPAVSTFGELRDGPCSKSQLTLVSRHVSGQLSAISKRDWKSAYSFAAKSFQASISEAEFAMIIESSYGLLISNKGFAFQECAIFNGEIMQGLVIQDDLQEILYGYQLSYIDNRLGIVGARALAEGKATSV